MTQYLWWLRVLHAVVAVLAFVAALVSVAQQNYGVAGVYTVAAVLQGLNWRAARGVR